uniref:Phytase A n=1 Tax=Talaromyces thermophilus TaxID=28565 RepID=O00096_TALTH|nr:phytase [Thermomyces dupontii]
MSLLLLVLSGGLVALYVSRNPHVDSHSCNTVEGGYQCRPEISHSWGQYSPFFSLADQSEISPDVPQNCKITFVQLLSRHGARYPTSSKTELYSQLISRIQKTATAYKGYYAFLKDYRYQLGANDLTPFGENQMIQLGIKFYNHYKSLARNAVPFVRCSGSDRVIASGRLFIEGFQSAKVLDPHSDKHDAPPTINVIIEEGPSYNNTLDTGSCPVFEDSSGGHDAQEKFAKQFAPAILEKIKDHLPGVDLAVSDVPYLMDLCPFETLARNHTDTLSPFCALSTQEEWQAYDYYQSLGKYYGNGGGNPLGPAQGVGFVNELIARMTHSPVQDYTTVNHTLDSNPATFPLNATLYADFSHDNTMTSIFAALGLYNGTAKLSTTEIKSIEETDGYSAAWTVPFGGRAYIEMMQCDDSDEPVVRVLVNDRVVPLHGCEVDSLGRCKRDDFVRGLSFARQGGNWEGCYAASE